jgi:hypothetical protein
MLSPGSYSEQTARRKFELSQKINDNTKLIGGLVYYILNLVPGQWVPLKPPRREGSRKLTADYRRHLTAALRVLRVRPHKRFSPDGESCEYYLNPGYESFLWAATGLDLRNPIIRVAFDALPSSFRLCDLQEFSDRYPEMLERTRAFLAMDYLQIEARLHPHKQTAPPESLFGAGRVRDPANEEQRREQYLSRNFGIEL